MEKSSVTEGRLRINIRGSRRVTRIEICVPTFWLWAVFALVLASQFPNLWKILQAILQSWR
jgi:hypothetical protein